MKTMKTNYKIATVLLFIFVLHTGQWDLMVMSCVTQPSQVLEWPQGTKMMGLLRLSWAV